MNDHVALCVSHPERNETRFTVVALVPSGQNITLEYQRRIENIDAAFSDNALTFVLVPFEFHLTELVCFVSCKRHDN